MTGYIDAILKRFHHPCPIKPELAPHQYASRSFSSNNSQAPIPEDDTARLDASGVLRVQRVLGCIFYYARAIDTPLLPTLTDIGSDQAKATKETRAATKKLLYFVAARVSWVAFAWSEPLSGRVGKRGGVYCAGVIEYTS